MLSAAIITMHPALAMPTYVIGSRIGPTITPAVGSNASAPYDPQQIRKAYGVDQIRFNGIVGDGAGQTIAIVDAFDDPNIIKDTDKFNTTFGLQQFNVGGPTFRVLNENGGTTLPTIKGQGWDVEESLDVQWAHAMAPQANIILFEADTNGGDLYQAVATAANFPGVSVVSNSWGSDELSTETQLDSIFTTPGGHQGVTFLVSTGDDGSPGGYPAYSPNAVAVGGTSLQIQDDGTYVGESVWSNADGATGGGVSQVESQPSYQVNNVNGLSSTKRTIPDISAEADPETGVFVYDTFSENGFLQVGGTSLSCPLWAGMIAIANQGRALAGETTLDGPSQTLPMLYGLPSGDFRDITVGNNGTFSALPGYDLVTGRGTPIANLLVPALGGYGKTAPIVDAPATGVVAENSSLIFSSTNGDAINLTDPFSAGSTDSLALSVSNGTLALSSLTGLTFTTGANGSASFTVSGTIANLNAALNGLIYQPNNNFAGVDTLNLALTDPGENLVGRSSTVLSIVASTGPKITAPTLASVSENASLVFSLTTGNSITILDNDAGGNSDGMTLSVSNGTLTLASTTGLTFTSGSNGSASFTVTGTVTDLNAALNGLAYQPNPGFFGADLLAVSVVDPGDDTSSSVDIALTINALAPAIAGPGTASVSEDQSLAFSTANGNAITVGDPNPGGDSLALSVSHGTLTLGTTSGLTFTVGGNGSSSFTVTGSLSSLETALDGITYQPTLSYVGGDSLSLSITNLTNGKSASTGVLLSIQALPAVTAPSSAIVAQNSAVTFASDLGNQIKVTDPAAGTNPDSLTLSVTNGRLTVGSMTGLVFTSGSNNSASFTVTASIGSLDAALNGLSYQPNLNYTGPDSLEVLLSNPRDGLGSTKSVALTVNPIVPPVITVPPPVSLSENSSVAFSTAHGNAISVADNGEGINADVETLSVSHGTLTLGTTTGLIFLAGSNGSASFTVKSDVSNFNAALNGLVYRPTTDFAGPDSLSISVNSADGKSGSGSLGLTVIALPPLITAPPSGSLSLNGSLAFLPANANTISITDANPVVDSLTLSVSHGTLTLASVVGLSFGTGTNGSASFTVSGPVPKLNAALNGLVYQPTSGYSGSDSLAITLLDSDDNQSATAQVSLNVSIPAPPSVNAPSTATVVQNGFLGFTSMNSNAITVTDAAAGANTDSLTLSVAHGTLTLATTSGLSFTTGTNGTASFVVTGSVANLNAALNGLAYRPAAGYVGSDLLSIGVTDSGDNESGSKIVALTVTGSIAPTITAPTGSLVSENGALAFSAATSNAIVVADSGPGSNSDALTLSVSHGTVALGSTSGLTITAGANGSSSITVTGSVANLDAALTGLIYQPTTGYIGSDALAIFILDAVNQQSATGSVSLAVKAGTAPSIKAPATVATKSSTVVFSNSAITVTDNNAGTSLQELSLKTTSGTLKLASIAGITFISGANNSASMLIEGTLANLNVALNGLSLAMASKTATVILAYVDLGNNLSGTAAINVSQGAGFSPTGGSAALSVGGTTNLAATSLPPDAETQWKGVTAAAQMLAG